MMTLSPLEQSAAPQKAFLSAKVSKALGRAVRNEGFDSGTREVFQRGSNLVDGILQGSLLIEKKQLEQGVRSDLLGYKHALQSLAPEHSAGDTSQIFAGYRDDLGALAEGRSVDMPRLAELAKFFRELSTRFFRDLKYSSGGEDPERFALA